MPIRQRIEPERRRIRVEVEGDFTMADILHAINSSVQDPAFEPGFDVLADHTRIGRPLTTEQAHEMVSHLEKLSDQVKNSRWAVVTSKPASYGMMRMVSVLARRIPITVEVFSSMDEAEAWLAGPSRRNP